MVSVVMAVVMYRRLKKIRSVLALLAVLFFLPVSVRAGWVYDDGAKTMTDGNWVLSVSRDAASALSIKGVESVTAGRTLDLRPPVVDAAGEEYPILSIDGFRDRGDVHEVYLPSGIVRIADYAFYRCPALEKVEPFLPDTIQYVGLQAFRDSAHLGGDLVGRNTHLTGIRESAFYGTSVRSVESANVERLELEPFQNCSSLVDARLPKIVDLGKWAFKNCTVLTNATLSADLERLQFQAFYNCPRLAKVTPFLPPSLTVLDGAVFWGCSSLNLPLVCPGLGAVGASAFMQSAITSADLPGVTTIGDQAFCSCPSLGAVRFGNGLEAIGYQAFFSCGKLTNAVPFLPDSVTSIGAEAFNMCAKLAGPLNLANPALTTFNRKSFRAMPLLHEVHFPPTSADFTKADSLFFNSGTPGEYYFPKSAPRLPLDREVFAYVGFKRSRLYGSLRLDPQGWRAFASDLTDGDRAAADYPGEKTFGVVVDPLSGVRHWLIDWQSPLESESALDVRAEPEGLPVACVPAPGTLGDLQKGDTVDCSSPATFESDEIHYTCIGYVLEKLSKGTPVSVTTNLGSRSFTYVHGENSGRLTWLFEADGYSLDVAPQIAGEGEVSVSLPPNFLGRWYAKGTKVALTARPAEGKHFTWWYGDMERKKQPSAAVVVTMDRPRVIRALFHPGWLYDPAAKTITDGGWVLSVSVDQEGKMAVKEDKSTDLQEVLDLRSPVVDREGNAYPIVFITGLHGSVNLREVLLPDSLASIGPSAFDSCPILEKVSPFLPTAVVSVGHSAFNNCTMLSGVLHLENPAMTTFAPRSFRALPKVNEVHFSPESADFSRSDSLFFNSGAPGAYYFPKFAPRLPIYNETFAYTGKKRSVLYGSLRLDPEGWAAIAEELTPADLAAPDYPGEKTFGVYTDPYPASRTRHWLVDWESPLEAVKMLKVAVEPAIRPA